MGSAALCSHLRALWSTGISCFTKSQVKLCAPSRCLVILALIWEAGAPGKWNAKRSYILRLLRASWHVPCKGTEGTRMICAGSEQPLILLSAACSHVRGSL